MHLATTRHLHCWEELSLWCSLDADASGASDERPRGSHQLHHCGDVRQHGEPLVCGTSVSRFDPGTSHYSHYLQDVPRELVRAPSSKRWRFDCLVNNWNYLRTNTVTNRDWHPVAPPQGCADWNAYRLSEKNKHYLQDNLRALSGSAINNDSVSLVQADIAQLVEQRIRNA